MESALGNAPVPGTISLLELFFLAFFVLGALAMGAILLAAALYAPKAGRRGAAAPAPQEPPKLASFKNRLDVVVYAGIGGFACFCVYQGLFGEHGLVTHPSLREIATLAVLLPLAVWIEIQFLHPRLERRFGDGEKAAHHPEIRFGRWDIRGTLALVTIFAVMDLVQHFAHEDLAFILASIGCTIVTWLWVCGAGTGRGRAVVLGGAGGLALGSVGVAAFFYLIHSGLIPDRSFPPDGVLTAEAARSTLAWMLVAVLATGLLLGALGAACGALVALLRGSKPGRRRTALFGALGGPAFYMLWGGFTLALGYAGHWGLPPNYLIPDGDIGAVDLRMRVIAVMEMDLLTGALYWALLGGIGGLWIDLLRSRRPMMGLLLLFPAVKLVNAAALLALEVGAKWIMLGGPGAWSTIDPRGYLLDFGAGLAVLLGWALGLTLCPSSDFVLGNRG